MKLTLRSQNMNRTLLKPVDVEDYTGIPWDDLDVICAACDEFFRKRGLPVYSIREQLHRETLTRMRWANAVSRRGLP
jgi:hypothetical protein